MYLFQEVNQKKYALVSNIHVKKTYPEGISKRCIYKKNRYFLRQNIEIMFRFLEYMWTLYFYMFYKLCVSTRYTFL